MWNEFKQFALRGNVVDLAIGIIIGAEAKNQGAVLAWGSFITAAINFLIIAWILFLLVKGMNRLRRKEDAKTGTADKPAELPADVKLLTEIRDLMKSGRTL